MMAHFPLSPDITMSTIISTRGSLQKGRARRNSKNVAYFGMALFSLVLALSYRHGEHRLNQWTISSFFLGTTPVATSLATSTALSVRHPRRSHSTMVSMTAGSSRTLIELAKPENDESRDFRIEVMYIDEDDEDTLMVLRRANVDTELDDTEIIAKNGRAVFRRAVRVLKNPVVSIVLTGNIATMAGILRPGIAGFLPALSVLLVRKTKMVLPMLQRLGSSRPWESTIVAPAFRAIFSKMKLKLHKAISFLYKNRSKSSLLGDFLCFVDVRDDKKSKRKNVDDDKDIDSSTRPFAHPVMA